MPRVNSARLPPYERAVEALAYEPTSGVLTWRVRPTHHFTSINTCNAWNGKMAGRVAGVEVTRDGRPDYSRLTFDGRSQLLHRVAWLLFYRAPPKDLLDHIDGNRRNNAIVNLREASFTENMWNRPAHSDSSSGLKGVDLRKTDGRWRARIAVNGRDIHLGLFDSAEAAHAAYRRAVAAHHGAFARVS